MSAFAGDCEAFLGRGTVCQTVPLPISSAALLFARTQPSFGRVRETNSALSMPRTEQIPIRLTHASGKISEGKIEIVSWTEPDIRAKAFRFSGTVLLLALLMVPIPIIHFVAIPMVLLGPPIVFVAVYKLYGGSSDTKGSAPCPSCGAAVDLTKQIDGWPIREICPQCRDSCVVDRKEA